MANALPTTAILTSAMISAPMIMTTRCTTAWDGGEAATAHEAVQWMASNKFVSLSDENEDHAFKENIYLNMGGEYRLGQHFKTRVDLHLR